MRARPDAMWGGVNTTQSREASSSRRTRPTPSGNPSRSAAYPDRNCRGSENSSGCRDWFPPGALLFQCWSKYWRCARFAGSYAAIRRKSGDGEQQAIAAPRTKKRRPLYVIAFGYRIQHRLPSLPPPLHIIIRALQALFADHCGPTGVTHAWMPRHARLHRARTLRHHRVVHFHLLVLRWLVVIHGTAATRRRKQARAVEGTVPCADGNANHARTATWQRRRR